MDLLPGALLRYSLHGRALVPHFLGEHDHPWLRELIDDAEAMVGRRECDLEERLRTPPDDLADAPLGRRAMAVFVLLRLWRRARARKSRGPALRAALFSRTQGVAGVGGVIGGGEEIASREEKLSTIARAFGLSTEELEEALFDDLPGQRRVEAMERAISPQELAGRTNLALAQSLLFRARRIRVRALDRTRAVVRQARLRGLLCVVRDDHCIEISGPFAIFRHTLVYGRALGELLPLLAWCRRYALQADCVIGEREAELRLGAGDPIYAGEEPILYDSRLEERLARDLRRCAPDWTLLREPEAVSVTLRGEAKLIFPDFALEHRHDPARRWLVEVVGFWTPGYLADKLASYRAAGLARLLLCIDDRLACEDGDLPAGAHVLRFRSRIDPAALLAIVDGAA